MPLEFFLESNHNRSKMKLTDAIARASAERNKSVRMTSDTVLRKEAFRLEGFRIGINKRTVVHAINH